MILYLDTSALARLFISEPGSEAVASAVGNALAVATHRIQWCHLERKRGRDLTWSLRGRPAPPWVVEN